MMGVMFRPTAYTIGHLTTREAFIALFTKLIIYAAISKIHELWPNETLMKAINGRHR